MKKVIIIVTLIFEMASNCKAQSLYMGAIKTSRNEAEATGYLYTAKDNNIVTDLEWETILMVGKYSTSGFKPISESYANHLIEKIDLIVNFKGKTENLSPIIIDCDESISFVRLEMDKISKYVMQGQTKTIAELFAGNDIEKLELILKVKYRDTNCTGALHPHPTNTEEEIFTIEIAYFGARFLFVDLADSPTGAAANWSQFTTGLSYTQATVGTNFSNKLAAVFTSPVFSFRSPNWFLNHFDIEYLITSIQTGEGGTDKVVTGMGGCFGFIGRNTKGLKLGVYRETETGKWFPF